MVQPQLQHTREVPTSERQGGGRYDPTGGASQFQAGGTKLAPVKIATELARDGATEAPRYGCTTATAPATPRHPRGRVVTAAAKQRGWPTVVGRCSLILD